MLKQALEAEAVMAQIIFTNRTPLMHKPGDNWYNKRAAIIDTFAFHGHYLTKHTTKTHTTWQIERNGGSGRSEATFERASLSR